jgi:hypothetical protein
MKKTTVVIVFCLFAVLPVAARAARTVDVPADVLEDKIRGGLIGQIFGNLNGLPHEMKYIEQPGQVESYTPSLPEGARTDDDTDIEWVYISEMARTKTLALPPARIAELWRANMNKGIWCANQYARNLLDLGIEPPLTGRIALNPWSVFNVSGQFVSEAFGLVAPAMPRTAGQLGTHYTHFAVDGEPIQTTQLFTAMIATAFVEPRLDRIVAAGLASVDPKSALVPIVKDVLGWWKESPGDWHTTRQKIRDKYTHNGGKNESDRNGYELNTGAIIAALLHGGGDLRETLRLSFNFGWDADCNAAITGTIVGVIKGAKWIAAQGWTIKDVYKNTTRDQMPKDETITGYGDKLVAVARMVIEGHGGKLVTAGGRSVYRIRAESAGPGERVPQPLDRAAELKKALAPAIAKDLGGEPRDRARAAYLALALGEADALATKRPDDWRAAMAELAKFPGVAKEIYGAPKPMAEPLQARATAAGLPRPVAAKKPSAPASAPAAAASP